MGYTKNLLRATIQMVSVNCQQSLYIPTIFVEIPVIDGLADMSRRDM